MITEAIDKRLKELEDSMPKAQQNVARAEMMLSHSREQVIRIDSAILALRGIKADIAAANAIAPESTATGG